MADDLDNAIDAAAAAAHAASAAWAGAVHSRAAAADSDAAAHALALALAATRSASDRADAVRSARTDALDTDQHGSATLRESAPESRSRSGGTLRVRRDRKEGTESE